jgi:hypothetical protein
MLTPEQMAALPYSGVQPGAEGFMATEFKELHGGHAVDILHWMGIQVPKGTAGRTQNDRKYILSVPPEGVESLRAWVYESRAEVFSNEFGIMPKGTAMINTIIDEVEMARGDRILVPSQNLLKRAFVKRGETFCQGESELTDELPHRFVNDITTVYLAGAAIDIDRYTVSQDEERTGIEWLDPPAVGTQYTVCYHHSPIWYYAGTSNHIPLRGTDGQRLLQRGAMQYVAIV